MNRTDLPTRPLTVQRPGRRFAAATIEWEELPSLARALRRTDFAAPAGHVWCSTEPMDLQPPAVGAAAPFAEPIDGMQVREFEGDSLFGHFLSGPAGH